VEIGGLLVIFPPPRILAGVTAPTSYNSSKLPPPKKSFPTD